jgi:hypothetical protein
MPRRLLPSGAARPLPAPRMSVERPASGDVGQLRRLIAPSAPAPGATHLDRRLRGCSRRSASPPRAPQHGSLSVSLPVRRPRTASANRDFGAYTGFNPTAYLERRQTVLRKAGPREYPLGAPGRLNSYKQQSTSQPTKRYGASRAGRFGLYPQRPAQGGRKWTRSPLLGTNIC